MLRVVLVWSRGASWVVFPSVTMHSLDLVENLVKFTGHLKLAGVSAGTHSLLLWKVPDAFATFTGTISCLHCRYSCYNNHATPLLHRVN